MHKIASVTVWMALALAAVVAFELFATIDEAQPAGTRTSFTVESVDGPSKGAALDSIATAAQQLGRTIFKVQPDPQDTTQSRILFAFVGDAGDFAAHGGYDRPAFSSRTTTTRVAPAGEITTQDLRGRYVTDASPGELTRLLALLAADGITATDSTASLPEFIVQTAGQSNVVGALVVMTVALALAASYSVSRHRKIYALKALHGYHPIDNLRAEVIAATLSYGVGLVGLAVIGVPLLGLVTHVRRAAEFLPVLGGVLLVLYLVLVALVALAVWTLPRMSIPVVLKGEQVSVRNGVLAAADQVAVVAIVLATTTATLDRIAAVNTSLEVSGQWSQGAPLYALRLSTSGTHEDDLSTAPGLAAVVASQEAAGEALLAQDPGSAASTKPGSADGASLEPFLVNNEYLARQTVDDADGRRITRPPEQTNTFTLLVPESYTGDEQALLGAYADYFRGFACVNGRADDDPYTCDPHGTLIRARDGQALFTYNGTAFLPAELQQGGMFLTDPVLAVVPAASGLLSPMTYLAAASAGDVLFTDPAALDAALQAQGVRDAFQGIDNAADAVTASVALSRQELRMDAFALALGWAVLTLSSLVMVAVYCDRRTRPLFVELIHGYSFFSRHWRYPAGTVALSAAGLAVAGIAGGSLADGRDLALGAAFVAVQLAVALVAIRIYEARFRADFVKRS